MTVGDIFLMELYHLNQILIYQKVSSRYFTNGIDVFIKIKKNSNCETYRIKANGISYSFKPNNTIVSSIKPDTFFWFDNELYKKLKWHNDSDGYKFMMLDVKKNPMSIKQHRLVFFARNNFIPDKHLVIDHINRNKSDNRYENLRLVSAKENSANVNKHEISIAHSKYLYEIVDVNTGIVVEHNITAGQVEKLIGLNKGLVNKYMKNQYIYKGGYRINESH